MQVIVFCRFSYPAQGGFQVEHDSLDARRAYLYAPRRMETRFALFEHLCLPSWRLQTDPDFTFVVLVGDCLPEPYFARLQELLRGLPQARIVARPSGPHRQVCRSVLNQMREDPQKPCLQVRHDDDDAVAIDFVEHLRQAAQDVQPVLSTHSLIGFDWNNGYTIRRGPSGVEMSDTIKPYLGVAQAVAVQGGVKQSVMNFAHSKLPRSMPTITFPSPEMYLRSHNAFNDSRQKPNISIPDFRPVTAKGTEILRARFGLNPDGVKAAFEPVLT